VVGPVCAAGAALAVPLLFVQSAILSAVLGKKDFVKTGVELTAEAARSGKWSNGVAGAES
jgi:hypothetical protein